MIPLMFILTSWGQTKQYFPEKHSAFTDLLLKKYKRKCTFCTLFMETATKTLGSKPINQTQLDFLDFVFFRKKAERSKKFYTDLMAKEHIPTMINPQTLRSPLLLHHRGLRAGQIICIVTSQVLKNSRYLDPSLVNESSWISLHIQIEIISAWTVFRNTQRFPIRHAVSMSCMLPVVPLHRIYSQDDVCSAAVRHVQHQHGIIQ